MYPCCRPAYNPFSTRVVPKKPVKLLAPHNLTNDMTTIPPKVKKLAPKPRPAPKTALDDLDSEPQIEEVESQENGHVDENMAVDEDWSEDMEARGYLYEFLKLTPRGAHGVGQVKKEKGKSQQYKSTFDQFINLSDVENGCILFCNLFYQLWFKIVQSVTTSLCLILQQPPPMGLMPI